MLHLPLATENVLNIHEGMLCTLLTLYNVQRYFSQCRSLLQQINCPILRGMDVYHKIKLMHFYFAREMTDKPNKKFKVKEIFI